MSFLTSPHVIQDLPFGKRYLYLSGGKIIETPNVIQTMVNQRVIDQYQQYYLETNFKPFSASTMQRILVFGQQTKSYSSRSAAKIKQVRSVAEIDVPAIDEEMAHSSARDKIIQECQLSHPIFYDTCNLCQLYATNKPTRFSISFLQDICTYFHLDIDSLLAIRKAPYIGLIYELIKSCTCKEKKKLSS